MEVILLEEMNETMGLVTQKEYIQEWIVEGQKSLVQNVEKIIFFKKSLMNVEENKDI